MNYEESRPIVAVDFDGTLTSNEFPDIGEINNNVVNWVRERKDNGATIILWTTRQNKKLQEALDFCDKEDIPIDYVNQNVPWLPFNTSQKIFADIYLDDRSLNLNGDPRDDIVQFSTEEEGKLKV